jgi:hypothetical protein
MNFISAVEEPALRVHVVSRRALHYRRALHDVAEAQSYVRAASGLCWFQGRLAIVQDDALLLALLDVSSGVVEAVELPLRADGARFFDVERGNKRDKADLEACVVVTWEQRPALLAFGSGSHPNRECVAIVQGHESGYRSALIEAHALYAQLHALPGFLTSELNLEGAVLVGGGLRLFQRSNGSPLGSGAPVCASCDLDFQALQRYLSSPGDCQPPMPHNLQHYDLGTIGGARLTVTDACSLRAGELLFTASAESSPNAFDDGAVQGSALGKIDASGARFCLLRDEQGRLVKDKVEGVALDPHDSGRAYLVFDPDDHRTPATLAEVTLHGF